MNTHKKQDLRTLFGSLIFGVGNRTRTCLALLDCKFAFGFAKMQTLPAPTLLALAASANYHSNKKHRDSRSYLYVFGAGDRT